MRIVVASVLVDDQDKALRFYTDVLGFVKKTKAAEAGTTSAAIRHNSATLALHATLRRTGTISVLLMNIRASRGRQHSSAPNAAAAHRTSGAHPPQLPSPTAT